MTEIPEHLLKRSRERRDAAGLPSEGGEAAASSPAAAAVPAKAAAAPAPAKAAAPPAAPAAKPVPAYVQAARTRKKIPFWAMSALGLLPIWGFLYVRGLTPEVKTVQGPMAIGETVYTGCAACHAADGSGGVGRPLWKGEVLKTFPKIEDQLNFVYTGSQAYAQAGLAIYGDPNREGGPHHPGYEGKGAYMPAQGGQITDAQILGVVCHERYTVAGADPAGAYADEYAKWCAPDAEEFLAVEGGTALTSIAGVGATPRAVAAG